MRKLKKNLLLIGGSGRNVGKTTLANAIIKKFSGENLLQNHDENRLQSGETLLQNSGDNPFHNRIIGLKVSTFRKNEDQFHGDHKIPSEIGFLIHKEDLSIGHKDTATMIRAGAERAYYIQTTADALNDAYSEFEKLHNDENLPIVCESRALTSFIKPGIFIMIIDTENIKDDSHAMMKIADIIVYYKDDDLSDITSLPDKLMLSSDGCWQINRK